MSCAFQRVMTGKTWEMIIEPEKPIPIDELETVITEGLGLHFPIHRSYEFNLLNKHWNDFIVDMAVRRKGELLDFLRNEDIPSFQKSIFFTGGISSMYRFNSASIDGKTLKLYIGITDFKDYIGTTQRALIDPEFRELLMKAGKEDNQDQSHYFANSLLF